MFERLRGWLLVAWPFLASAAAVSVVVTMAVIIGGTLAERDAQAETLRQVKEATEINRRLIQRGNPCLPNDDPNSEACVAQAIRDAQLRDALAAVQEQHDEQQKQVDDAVARLIELQERQHGVSVTPRVPSTIPKRPTPRITASGPTPTTPAPSASPTTTAAPETTTTTTCPTNKAGKCRG